MLLSFLSRYWELFVHNNKKQLRKTTLVFEYRSVRLTAERYKPMTLTRLLKSFHVIISITFRHGLDLRHHLNLCSCPARNFLPTLVKATPFEYLFALDFSLFRCRASPLPPPPTQKVRSCTSILISGICVIVKVPEMVSFETLKQPPRIYRAKTIGKIGDNSHERSYGQHETPSMISYTSVYHLLVYLGRCTY